MLDPVTLFRDGSPFMYLILMALPVAALGSMTPLLAAVLKRRIPTAVTMGFVLLPAALGTAGWLQSLGLVKGAVQACSDEMLAPLTAMGLSVSLFTVIAGGGASGGLALFAALQDLGVSFLAHRDPDQVAATRASRRSGGFLLAGVGFTALGVARVAMAGAAYWQAQARASYEMRATLMAHATEGLSTTVLVFVAVAGVCLLAALVPVAATASARSARTAAGAVAALLVAAVPCVPVAIGAPLFAELWSLSVPWDVRRAEALAQAPVDLPVGTVLDPTLSPVATVRWPFDDATEVYLPRETTDVASLRAEGPLQVRVEAPGTTRLVDLWTTVNDVAFEATARTRDGALRRMFVWQAPEVAKRPEDHHLLVLTTNPPELWHAHNGDASFDRTLDPDVLVPCEQFEAEVVAIVADDTTLADVAALQDTLGWRKSTRGRVPCTLMFAMEAPPARPEEEDVP